MKMNTPTPRAKIGFTIWLEWFVLTGILLVGAAAIYTAFISSKTETGNGTVFSQMTQRADALAQVPDVIRRDAMCIPLSSFCRSMEAQLPTNSRVFLLDMLGLDNNGKGGYYQFFRYYLYPREVAVSLGQPAKWETGSLIGHNPASMEELAQAGYDVAFKMTAEGCKTFGLKPITPRSVNTKDTIIPEADAKIVCLLPLALALAGSRLTRWLFLDLRGVLSVGEWLAAGLAVGMFLLTQLILMLRIMGARLEFFLGIFILLWALAELALWVRGLKSDRPQFNRQHWWWLLLVPAGMILWLLFRLAGLEGFQEFDAIGNWGFKAKLLFNTSGKEIWAWTTKAGLADSHLDYPLTVSLLYSFTYGVLGHVNEFVIKFWNEWMLLFLVLATLGAGRFPARRPWLSVSAATIMVTIPFTLLFACNEGGTVPLFFFVSLASVQLALGLVDGQSGRLRLGLFLLMGAAMVKFEGAILLGIWIVLLLLNRESRAIFWPMTNLSLAAAIGVLAWIPYLFYRGHVSVGNPDAGGMGLLLHHWKDTWSFVPMIWVTLVSRRFFNADFASWISADNLHAEWNGKWTGLESLADQATPGIGWVCALVLILFWLRGQRFRWTAFCFFTLFMLFTIPICIEIIAYSSNKTATQGLQVVNYSAALRGASELINGGRYLSPILMSGFMAAAVLLARGITLQAASQKYGKGNAAAPLKKSPNK